MAASAEWKAFQDSLTPAPNADVLQQLQLEKERTANQAELLKVMQQRNATLEAEMEALHTKNKALEASSASKTLANRTVLPKPSSGIVSATITKKPITPAASITSKSHAKESAKDKELIRDLNKEVEDLRKANKTLSRQLQDLQAQLHQSSTRPPVPMASNSDVQLAEQLRQDNIFLQQSLDSKQALVTSLTLEYDKLAALHAQTRSDLDEARSKLMTSEGTCRELEFQLSTLNDKYQKLMEVSARVQSDRDHIQDGDLRHRESLFAMKIELEERNDEVRKCRQEIEALQAQLSSRSRPASTPANPLLVPSAESHGEYKEHITELQAETNLFKDRYRELQEDYAELMQAADVQKQGHAALQQQYSMLSTDYNSLKDSYAQVQKKVMALEVNQTDLQHVCSMESRKRQNAEEELSRLRAETTTQLQAINQLKDLVQTMSQNLAVEQNRVKVLERTMKGREEQEQWHDEHKAKATETIHLLEDEVNKYKQIVYILDQEKDDLHDKLDVLEEKNRQYAQEIRNLQSKVSDYESEVVQLQKREEKYKKDVAAKINALGLLEAKCNNLECQYSAAKESLQQKAITLNHHSEDLMLMTKENQVLNNTLINLNNELTHVKGMQQDAQRRIRTLEEEKKIMEIEKNDLLVHYKTLVKDKQHLEEDIKVLSSQQREGMNSASSLSRQLQDCQELLKSQSSALQNHAQERAGLQTQVVQLNELVVQLQRKVEAVEADNRRMIQVGASCIITISSDWRRVVG